MHYCCVALIEANELLDGEVQLTAVIRMRIGLL